MNQDRKRGILGTKLIPYALLGLVLLLVFVLLSPAFWLVGNFTLAPQLYQILANVSGGLLALLVVAGVFGLQTCQSLGQEIQRRYYAQLQNLLERAMTFVRWQMLWSLPEGLKVHGETLGRFLDRRPVGEDITAWASGTFAGQEAADAIKNSEHLIDLDEKHRNLETCRAHLWTSRPTLGALRKASECASRAVQAVRRKGADEPVVIEGLREGLESLFHYSRRIRRCFWVALLCLVFSILLCLAGYILSQKQLDSWEVLSVTLSALGLVVGVGFGYGLLQAVSDFGKQMEE